MGLGDIYNGVKNGWPYRTAEALIKYSARPVWERVIGASLTAPEIRQRVAEVPVQKAQLAARIIHEAQAQDEQTVKDPRLLQIGEALAVTAVADTADNPDDLVTQTAVVDVVASLPVGDVANNPLIAPHVADKAAAVLSEIEAADNVQP